MVNGPGLVPNSLEVDPAFSRGLVQTEDAPELVPSSMLAYGAKAEFYTTYSEMASGWSILLPRIKNGVLDAVSMLLSLSSGHVSYFPRSSMLRSASNSAMRSLARPQKAFSLQITYL